MDGLSDGAHAPKPLRGMFVNTARANCSIFESGRMVYECITHSQDYDLDYLSLDMFDNDYFLQTGIFRLNDSSAVFLPNNYDFFIFNWHFITMSALPPENLANLPGRKFSIVLELEPGDPLKLIPSDAFDGYIALDPSAPRIGKIYPFPRPLEGQPREPGQPRSEAPVIGSFGFGTPGKGFELLVEAANREFERATVRINIPVGTYTSFADLHGTNYPAHIEAMCRRIAKPGIDVVFTRDFLDPDGVVEWCAANDLNCFMYTRRQPGLSATTDQAIMSGRPLLTLSNDTFRHIHRYIPAYPQVSLRQAIATSIPAVRQIQQDWSREAFGRTFSSMLASFGLIERPVVEVGSVHASAPVTLIAHRGDGGTDLSDYPKRLADAVGRSGQIRPVVAHCATLFDLRSTVSKIRPDNVVLLDFETEDRPALAAALVEVGGAKILLAEDAIRAEPFTVLTRRPIVPFFTVNVPLQPGPPSIWLVGFDDAPLALDRAVRKISGEIDAVEILVEAQDPDAPALVARLESLRRTLNLPPAVALKAASVPSAGEAAVACVAAASLLVFRNDPAQRHRIVNLASLCLITERAVVFSRAAPLFPFADLGTGFEEAAVPDLIALGISAQIALLAEFGEWRTVAAMTAALSGNPEAWDSSLTGPVLRPTTVEALLSLPNDETFLQAAYRAIFGRAVDPEGRSHFLAKLRQGRSDRARILLDLAGSREAGVSGTGIVGLDDLRRRNRRDRLAGLNPWRRSRGRPDASGAVNGSEPSLDSIAPQSLDVIRDTLTALSAEAPKAVCSHSPAMRALLAHARNLDRTDTGASEVIAEAADAPTPLLEEVGVSDGAAPTPATFVATDCAFPQSEVAHPPRSSDGTIFCLIGVVGTAAHAFRGLPRQIGQALLDQPNRVVRFVTWNAATRQLNALDGTGDAVLAPNEALGGADPMAETGVPVEAAHCADGDWLVVPGPIRVDLDDPDLVEVDAIVEARRLKLRTAFIVAGTDPLRRPEDLGARASAHEQYIQALLLADLLLPVSEAVRDDLTILMTGHHLASWGPTTRTIPVPKDELAAAQDGWATYVRNLDAALGAVADPAQRIHAVYVIVDPDGEISDFAVGLLQALNAVAVTVIPVTWDAEARRTMPVAADRLDDRISWGDGIAPDQMGAPGWLLVADRASAFRIEAMRSFLDVHELRAAVLLDEAFVSGPGNDGTLSIDSVLLGNIALADKVLATSKASYDTVYRWLLSWRGKAQSVEHRFRILAAPAPEVPVCGPEWSAYLRSLRTELATDRLTDGLDLYRGPGIDPYTAFPNLTSRPKLSLCISTYKRAGWLSQNLKNIFSQLPEQRDDLEVLVIDNASPDNTPEIVEPYLTRRDFRYARNRKNVGMLGNLRVTVQRARGEYIWIIGDDDLTRQGCILSVLDALHRNPGIALVYLNYGYTSEPDPLSVKDLPAFLDAYNVLEPASENELAPIKYLAPKNENFFTAIYSHVYRRDHGMRAYCQDTTERIFSTMLSCVPTAYYVLNYMTDEMGYWIGEPSLVVNSNVSWIDYGTLFDLEQMPRTWDLAERHGTPAYLVDSRRSNRLWLIALMWKEIFEDDRAQNWPYFDASRVLMRLKHLPKIDACVDQMRNVYATAHLAGHPGATVPPETLFLAFDRA